MRLLFWLCCGLIVYAYVGYAVWLYIYARLHPRPVVRAPWQPSVSIVMAVRDEALNLPRKLLNLRELNYPPDKLQVLVVSDGSTDDTVEMLEGARPFVTPVVREVSEGKACALNAAVRQATGEILLFLDVRQTVDPPAAAELMTCFADPQVGAASGELLLESAGGGAAPDAIGIYWVIEKMVRRLESSSGSVVGVTGAIYALRRDLYVDIPRGTILDDVFVPMCAARRGQRVVFQPTAVARDRVFAQKGKEFSRKVRTLTGNYQLVQLAPWLLSRENPLLFRFISHKLLRLAVPGLLLLLLVASLAAGGLFYRLAFFAQVAMYAAALLGELSPASRRLKPVSIAHTFVLLNAAAAVAFYNFLVGREKVWV